MNREGAVRVFREGAIRVNREGAVRVIREGAVRVIRERHWIEVGVAGLVFAFPSLERISRCREAAAEPKYVPQV